MRYPASEKLEIIRLVEQSHLGVGSTLDKPGVPKTTFYLWYDRFLAFGDAGLEDRNSSPGRVWCPPSAPVRQIEGIEGVGVGARESACSQQATSGHPVQNPAIRIAAGRNDNIGGVDWRLWLKLLDRTAGFDPILERTKVPYVLIP